MVHEVEVGGLVLGDVIEDTVDVLINGNLLRAVCDALRNLVERYLGAS